MDNIKQNLLIVAASGLGKTGVPNVIFQVVLSLHEFFNIDVVVYNGENYYEKRIKECGCNIIRINDHEPKGTFKRFMWRLFKEKRMYSKIFNKIFKAKTYVAVHSFREYDSAYIFKEAVKHNVRERIIHCNNEISRPKSIVSNFFRNNKEKIIRRLTTQLVGVSSNCCAKSYPGMEHTVIFNSYDESRFNNEIKKDTNDKDINLLHVATFSTRKNQLFSLEILNELLKKKLDVNLYLAGTEVEPGYLEKIRIRTEQLNLQSNVHFIDGNSDLMGLYKSASFFLLPSLHEAAPITLVEAQACGIMCFASDTITKDMQCGGVKYLPISDAVRWSDEILCAYNDLGNKRIKYDIHRFSSDSFRKNIRALYGIN